MNDKIILGTVQFGLTYGINNSVGKPQVADIFQMLDIAMAAGVKSLDTASQYGDSEQIIGAYHESRQEYFRINTKFKDQSATPIAQQLNTSFKNLKVPTIEIYFFHSFNDFAGNKGDLTELRKLKDLGKIKKLGVSVYHNHEIEKVSECSDIDVIQIPFNILDNAQQRMSAITKAKEYGKTIQCRSVFLQGLFFKSLTEYPEFLFPLRKYVEQIQRISDEQGTTMENLCLSYVLSQPLIDEVLIGVDSVSQLKRNLSVGESPLNPKVLDQINSIQVSERQLLYPINWK